MANYKPEAFYFLLRQSLAVLLPKPPKFWDHSCKQLCF
jgi:hypothetical protein